MENKNVKKVVSTEELTREQLQEIMDSQTVFALAVLMMDIHTGTLMKNKPLVANSFMKAQVVLQNNPGFPARFKAAQQAIKNAVQSEQPPAPDLISARPAGVSTRCFNEPTGTLSQEDEHA